MEVMTGRQMMSLDDKRQFTLVVPHDSQQDWRREQKAEQ